MKKSGVVIIQKLSRQDDNNEITNENYLLFLRFSSSYEIIYCYSTKMGENNKNNDNGLIL